MHITENPKVGNLLAREGEKSSTLPFDRLSCWLITEELTAMDAGKTHPCENLWFLDDYLNNVASIFGKCLVDGINV